MKHFAAIVGLIGLISGTAASEPVLPISTGNYIFVHRFAEHPEMRSIALKGNVDGYRIVLINEQVSDIFPHGVIVDGTLMWHEKMGEWIIGNSEADRNAEEVGGCSDGPEVIDLKNKIYWTC